MKYYNSTLKCLNSSIFVTFFLLYALSSYAQVADKAENISPLLVGEKIPADSVMDDSGTMRSLADIIAEKATLLVIFRGAWCPYCNVHLAQIAAAEEEILKLGYQIIAVSPDSYQKIAHIKSKNKIKYQVYADKDGRLITKMGLAFDTGGKRGILPVPAVMVINRDSEILFEHINPNYKLRMQTEYILAVLKALQRQ